MGPAYHTAQTFVSAAPLCLWGLWCVGKQRLPRLRSRERGSMGSMSRCQRVGTRTPQQHLVPCPASMPMTRFLRHDQTPCTLGERKGGRLQGTPKDQPSQPALAQTLPVSLPGAQGDPRPFTLASYPIPEQPRPTGHHLWGRGPWMPQRGTQVVSPTHSAPEHPDKSHDRLWRAGCQEVGFGWQGHLLAPSLRTGG